MPRPRLYATNEERQRAYRKRLGETTYIVDKEALDRLHNQIDQLRDAVWDACAAGDPIAKQVRAHSADLVIHQLTVYFRKQGGTREGGKA